MKVLLSVGLFISIFIGTWNAGSQPIEIVARYEEAKHLDNLSDRQLEDAIASVDSQMLVNRLDILIDTLDEMIEAGYLVNRASYEAVISLRNQVPAEAGVDNPTFRSILKKLEDYLWYVGNTTLTPYKEPDINPAQYFMSAKCLLLMISTILAVIWYKIMHKVEFYLSQREKKKNS